MGYLYFEDEIPRESVKIIFELGSRDLYDAKALTSFYTDSVCYSFECNPDCLDTCKKTLENFTKDEKEKIFLIEKAVSINNGKITFRPFDLSKYNNKGASSIFEIDFSNRSKNDADYNRGSVQTIIEVDGIRLDTYMEDEKISRIDLLCIDLQGYELLALKSLGEKIKNVKYIITECSIQSTYKGGANFIDLNTYLEECGFIYVKSNRWDFSFPDLNIKGFSEFDAFFKRKD